MSKWDKCADISELVGNKIIGVHRRDDDYIRFELEDGRDMELYHEQDCCESVYLEDVIGADLKDLIGETVLVAEETIDCGETDYGDSTTWTFYHIRTNLHTITLRWYGSSNGYYSESVSCFLFKTSRPDQRPVMVCCNSCYYTPINRNEHSTCPACDMPL